MSDTILAAYTTLVLAQGVSPYQAVALGGTATVGGTIQNAAGAAGPIAWTATATSNLAAGGGGVRSDFQTEAGALQSFSIGGVASPAVIDGIDPVGLLVSRGQGLFEYQTTTTSYSFSAPLPAGTVFVIDDPISNLDYVDGTGVSSTLSARLGATSVATANWTVTEDSTYAAPKTTTLGSSAIIVAGTEHYDEIGVLPRPHILVTTTTPLDGITVVSRSQTQDAAGLYVIVPTQPMVDTIAGADGVTRTLDFGSANLATRAQPLLDAVTASTALFIDAAGTATLAAGQTAAVDAVPLSTGVVSLAGNGAAGERIVSGAGGLDFTGAGGSGTVIAGGGNNIVYLPAGGSPGGGWDVLLGDGPNAVVAAAGNDTITTGTGANLVFLGSGASSVASAGADTVNGGAGSATVSVMGANSDLAIDANGPLTFIAGTGASTVVAGEVAATLFGGASGGTLAFGRGRMDYVGGGATDTVSALSGSLTARGGAGGGVFFGGTAGGNAITATSGDVTAQGGGAGDLLAATGAGDVLFSGGTGAETLTGAGSMGNDILLAGSGPEALVSGHGNTVQVAGAGADSMTGDDSGATLFLFVGGLTAGASDTITGFDPTHDFLRLLNYSGSTADVLRNASVGSGAANSGNPYPTTTIALSDGTHVTFLGVRQLDAHSFI